jgi:S-disulfanyl-L-cysteine oxidoreductase SoxD
MRSSLRVLAPAVILAAAIPAAVLAQSQGRLYPNVGTPLTEKEIKGFDRIIGPDGKELPDGRGTVKEGEVVYKARCEVCHGVNGEGGILRRLTIGKPGAPYRGNYYFENQDKMNGISYYPNPVIAWDYINRAMPVPNPGTLKPNEVYSLVAFLYYRNGIINENDVMDRNTLPKVVMPNKDGFVPAVPVYPPAKAPSWW